MKEEKEGEGTRNERSGKGLIYMETAKRYGTTCVCVEEMIPDYETMDYAARRNCLQKLIDFFFIEARSIRSAPLGNYKIKSVPSCVFPGEESKSGPGRG